MGQVNPFVVLSVPHPLFGYKVLGDMPTPALIDASNDGRRHEAYQHPETGFWRLRDDKYDAPDTVYTEVYVSHVPVCPGVRGMGIDHMLEWGTQTFGPNDQCRQCAEDDGIIERKEDE